MNVIHRQHLPPSGVEFSCQASLTPSTLSRYSDVILSSRSRPKPITNLIIARSTLLQVFELCLTDDDFENNHLRNHEENKNKKKKYKLFHVCEHRLHGRVTGIQRLTTLDTQEDGLDRLLVSFQDAKMTLLEWSNPAADLVPISLHTFEKLPQITQGDLPRDFQAQLEVDPLSRCAVLLLPQATLAVLPFFQDQLDLDGLGLSGGLNSALGPEQQRFQSLPYASSFILDFNQQLLNHLPPVLENQQRPIKSVIALKFLPGFSEPTLAVLYQTQYTWSARLENDTNSTALIVLTLDLGSNHFPIISHTKNLPYDAHGLVACPKELAGVLVLCADMILHVDQSSKIIGVATNGWIKHTSELQIPRQETVQLITPATNVAHLLSNNLERGEDLEDGEEQDDKHMPDGHEELLIRLDNSKIVFSKPDLAFVFLRNGQLSDECLFVGSMLGDSALYAIDELYIQTSNDRPTNAQIQTSKVVKTQTNIDIDEDIYGERVEANHAQANDPSRLYDTHISNSAEDGRTGGLQSPKPFLRLCDVIEAHGPIRDFTMASTGVENMPLELLACTGSGDLGGLSVFHREIPLRKRRKLSLDQSASKIRALFVTPLLDDGMSADERRLIWMVRSGPRTEIATYGDSDEISIINTFPEKTLAVSSFFGKDLSFSKPNTSGLEEAQVIQPEPAVRIKRASITEDYVMLETYCGLKLIYQGNHESKTLSKLPFPPESDEVQTASILKSLYPFTTVNEEEDLYNNVQQDSNGDVEMQPKADSTEEIKSQTTGDCNEACWLFTTTRNGSFQVRGNRLLRASSLIWIRDLPTLALVYTAARIDTLPETISDEEKFDGDTQPVELFGAVDEAAPPEQIAHIFGFLTGAIASPPSSCIYEILTNFTIPIRLPEKEGHPAVLLKKVIARQLESIQDHDEIPAEPEDHDMEQSSPNDEETPSRSFTSIKMDGKFKGIYLADISSTLVKTGRPFNKVFYDSSSQTVVEGNLMWQPDDDSLIRATTFRSSLELILPGKWVTIDGYEFQQNEWGDVDGQSEDLAARGGIYVFEIIQVNRAERHHEYNRALRLRYYEETKACVTAVDAINGYFLHSMGQKLYAKCFEQDERLLAVGFLDIKPYATCLRIFKNFILLGDAVKGITLVAFQEEPYKLIELGHTYVDLKCSTVDFLVIDAKLAIVATDLNGIIRIFEYNPTNIESQGGQKLLCRTEFNTSSEMSCSMQFGKRLSPKDEAKVMGTFFASLDGSISSLVPAKDAVYKRLQLVQTRLTRHIQHFAGLNPKGHRTVRNDMVSRAINRGILDGELLMKFELLSISQQREIASLAGSDRETVLVNLQNLRGLW
ncbi:hypothetical protein KEM48_003453 [Puccinia striiformis f. sp. tritici PST-130]|nr:hypothetical protein KEM48_003453 [Puccinia striiformis f. sp. tritici PST-130]